MQVEHDGTVSSGESAFDQHFSKLSIATSIGLASNSSSISILSPAREAREHPRQTQPQQQQQEQEQPPNPSTSGCVHFDITYTSLV
jgi:hypothetical protein